MACLSRQTFTGSFTVSLGGFFGKKHISLSLLTGAETAWIEPERSDSQADLLVRTQTNDINHVFYQHTCFLIHRIERLQMDKPSAHLKSDPSRFKSLLKVLFDLNYMSGGNCH